MYRYHQDFVITVVDNLLENITLGLEQNDFKFNQRRLAEVKYLGELYNYKVVDSLVVFDTMYRIVTFGHGETNHKWKYFINILPSEQLAHSRAYQSAGFARRFLSHSSYL